MCPKRGGRRFGEYPTFSPIRPKNILERNLSGWPFISVGKDKICKNWCQRTGQLAQKKKKDEVRFPINSLQQNKIGLNVSKKEQRREGRKVLENTGEKGLFLNQHARPEDTEKYSVFVQCSPKYNRAKAHNPISSFPTLTLGEDTCSGCALGLCVARIFLWLSFEAHTQQSLPSCSRDEGLIN